MIAFVLLSALLGYLVIRSRAAGVPQPQSTPYVRLFSELNNSSEAKAANTDQKVAELKTWYKHIHGEASNPNSFSLGNATKKDASDKTFAKRLADAGIWSSQYRNGSYVSQANSGDPLFSEAKDIEQNAPLAIGAFWPGNYTPYDVGDNNAGGGRLQQELLNNTNNVTVQISVATNRPAGTPASWPFINSKDGNGNGYSDSTADYVSWIRIHNEVMQIISDPVESGGIISFQVKRGVWGTGTANHAASTRVFSPTYIGNTSAVASDGGLAGSPAVNSSSKALRYSIKIWKPEGYNWIANRIKTSFGTDLQGYNTIHLDVSSCNQYNNAAADGKDVWNWDDDNFKKMSRDQWGQYQKQKVAGLRAALPGVKFTGNNLFGATTSQNNSCTNDLLATAYDGGVFEHWMKYEGYSLDFASAMDQNFKVQINNWPALYWVRWNYDFSGNVDQYKRFSYGALLLAYRTAADKYQYGGLWGVNKPDPLYFYNFGNPKTNPQNLSEVAISGQTDLYKRDFDNGFVIVNSGSTAKNYTLGTGEFYKIDVAGNPTLVSGQVSIGAKDSIFIMGGSNEPAPSPTLKKPMQGVLDRKGFPKSGYEEVVNGYVVDVDWKDLQPNSINDAIASNNVIDQALSAIRQTNNSNPGRNMHLKIRLFTGDKSPNWAKQLAGGPVNYIEPQNNITTTIPKFWSNEFKNAYDQFIEKLAAKYDNEEEVRDVTISRCMTVFAETFIRGITDATNRQNLVDAGLTPDLDKQCHKEQVDAHAVLARTRSSLAFNPWQYINTSTVKGNTDLSFTNEMMTYCRNKLGQRCILENNSIRDEATTSEPLGNTYATMYANMKSLGPPILFQTATESRIGDWRKTLEWAVTQGANAVELNSSYGTYPVEEVRTYDNQLESNAIDGSVTPPPAVEVKVPTQVEVTAGDASATLSWQNDNTLPVDFVVSYRKVGDAVWLWPGTTTNTQYQFSSLTNNQEYEFRVRARYTDSEGNKTLSSDTNPVLATPKASTATELGDINKDSKVDIFDLSILLSRWQVQSSNESADLNNDGTVNVFDLSILLSNWT